MVTVPLWVAVMLLSFDLVGVVWAASHWIRPEIARRRYEHAVRKHYRNFS